MIEKIVHLILLSLLLSGCLSSNQVTTLPTVTETKAVSPLTPNLPITSTTPALSTELRTRTPLQSFNQNGVSLIVYWLYADQFRIAIEYKVQGVKIPDGYSLPCPVQTMMLADPAKNLQGSYAYGYGDSENLLTNCRYLPDGSFLITHNFYLPKPEGITEFNVSIDISVGGMPVFSDTGGTANILDYGDFHLEHKIQSNGNLTFNPDERVSKNGLTATLDRVEINPSFVNTHMCIDYENQKEWYPESSLQLNGQRMDADALLTFRTDLQNIDLSNWFNQFTSHRCFRFTFPTGDYAILDSLPAQITITLDQMTIDILQAATQDDCIAVKNKVQQSYPDLDFTCQIDSRDGGYGVLISILRTPAGMTQVDAQKIAEEGFLSVVQGPWSFSLEVP